MLRAPSLAALAAAVLGVGASAAAARPAKVRHWVLQYPCGWRFDDENGLIADIGTGDGVALSLASPAFLT